jgi:ribosome maturation protein SDO1
MSRAINLPSQSVKLTNVAIVRLTVNGKRFEVACYKNKVLDYRNGLETDLSEVLQTPSIFTNVTKGQLAKASDCRAAFGPNQTTEQMAITILQKGKSLQVSEVERNQLYETTLTQIATHLATTCFHPLTGKPYTAAQIKQALTAAAPTEKATPAAGEEVLHFSVQPHKPLKQQYLHALKYLQQRGLPIVRAAMELEWLYENEQSAEVSAILEELHIASAAVPPSTTDSSHVQRLIVDPSLYRPLQEMATQRVPGSRIEIVRQQVFEKREDVLGEYTSGTAPGEPNESPLAVEDDNNDGEYAENDAVDHVTEEEEEEEEVEVAPIPRKQKKKKHLQMLQQQMETVAIVDDDGKDQDPSRRQPEESRPIASAASVESSTTTAEGANVQRCNTCPGSEFTTPAEYRAHFRSDWHRYNLKLKLQQCAPIRYEEFVQCDAESFFTADTDL